MIYFYRSTFIHNEHSHNFVYMCIYILCKIRNEKKKETKKTEIQYSLFITRSKSIKPGNKRDSKFKRTSFFLIKYSRVSLMNKRTPSRDKEITNSRRRWNEKISVSRDLNNFTYSIRGRIQFNSTDSRVRTRNDRKNKSHVYLRNQSLEDSFRCCSKPTAKSWRLSSLISLFRLPFDRSLRFKILRDRQRMRTFTEQHNRGVRMHAKVPTEASTCLREQWQDLCKSLRASQSRLPFQFVVDQKQTHAMPTSR